MLILYFGRVSANIVGMYNEYQRNYGVKVPKIISTPSFSKLVPNGFFDGSSQWGHYGYGTVIRVDDIHIYSMWMGCGDGTNTNGSLGSAFFALFKGILSFQVAGDSSVVIDWAERTLNLLGSLDAQD